MQIKPLIIAFFLFFGFGSSGDSQILFPLLKRDWNGDYLAYDTLEVSGGIAGHEEKLDTFFYDSVTYSIHKTRVDKFVDIKNDSLFYYDLRRSYRYGNIRLLNPGDTMNWHCEVSRIAVKQINFAQMSSVFHQANKWIAKPTWNMKKVPTWLLLTGPIFLYVTTKGSNGDKHNMEVMVTNFYGGYRETDIRSHDLWYLFIRFDNNIERHIWFKKIKEAIRNPQ